jgi:hypothetical protein
VLVFLIVPSVTEVPFGKRLMSVVALAGLNPFDTTQFSNSCHKIIESQPVSVLNETAAVKKQQKLLRVVHDVINSRKIVVHMFACLLVYFLCRK